MNINNSLLKSIQIIASELISKASFDKNKKGIIIQSNTNNTYSVSIDGNTYNNIKVCGGARFAVNDIVRVIIPQNQMSQMYIDGASSALGMLNFYYPVGSCYETSDNNFDPNISWGGVWEIETNSQVNNIIVNMWHRTS